MKDWLSEVIDQIALGHFLATTKLSCGQRFGLITIDNAIEFMLIAYVEIHKQMVGKPPPMGITRKDWEQKKREVPVLLSFVTSLEPDLSPLESDIKTYHKLRNDLYHTGMPLTVSEERVIKFAKLAKNVLTVLYRITYSEADWDLQIHKVAQSLSNIQISSLNYPVEYEEVNSYIRFITPSNTTAKQAIALCLHGYATKLGRYPSRSDLMRSLVLSGKSINERTLTARLVELRKEGWLQKGVLKLKDKAITSIRKKYII